MPSFFEKYGPAFATITTMIIAFAALAGIIYQNSNTQQKLISQHFNAVDQRLDSLKDSVNQRIDDLKDDMNQRFNTMDKRLDRLTDEVSELRKLTVGIGERVSRNEGAINSIQKQIQAADTPSR